MTFKLHARGCAVAFALAVSLLSACSEEPPTSPVGPEAAKAGMRQVVSQGTGGRDLVLVLESATRTSSSENYGLSIAEFYAPNARVLPEGRNAIRQTIETAAGKSEVTMRSMNGEPISQIEVMTNGEKSGLVRYVWASSLGGSTLIREERFSYQDGKILMVQSLTPNSILNSRSIAVWHTEVVPPSREAYQQQDPEWCAQDPECSADSGGGGAGEGPCAVYYFVYTMTGVAATAADLLVPPACIIGGIFTLGTSCITALGVAATAWAAVGVALIALNECKARFHITMNGAARDPEILLACQPSSRGERYNRVGAPWAAV